jgi:hypothetical protein
MTRIRISKLRAQLGAPAKKKTRAKSPRDSGSLLAWRCVVLAVDTAANSGWAIRCDGKLAYSGELDTLDAQELDDVIATASGLAHINSDRPLVLVLERAYGGSMSTIAGLAAARERWLAGWRRARRSIGHVVSVYPVTWRALILPRGCTRMKRDEVRPYEIAAAQHEVNACAIARKARFPTYGVGDDEAAAILIARWAARAPQVGKVLPKRVRELSVQLPAAGTVRP